MGSQIRPYFWFFFSKVAYLTQWWAFQGLMWGPRCLIFVSRESLTQRRMVYRRSFTVESLHRICVMDAFFLKPVIVGNATTAENHVRQIRVLLFPKTQRFLEISGAFCKGSWWEKKMEMTIYPNLIDVPDGCTKLWCACKFKNWKECGESFPTVPLGTPCDTNSPLRAPAKLSEFRRKSWSFGFLKFFEKLQNSKIFYEIHSTLQERVCVVWSSKDTVGKL